MSANLIGISSIAILVPAVALWIRRIRTVSIPDDRKGFVAAFLVAASLGVAALVAGPPVWPIHAALWVTTAVGLFLPFSVLISAQKTGEGTIGVGQTLPAFRASDDDGALFDSETLRGHPVLIKFFRGHW